MFLPLKFISKIAINVSFAALYPSVSLFKAESVVLKKVKGLHGSCQTWQGSWESWQGSLVMTLGSVPSRMSLGSEAVEAMEAILSPSL